jgi:hypothetical protein
MKRAKALVLALSLLLVVGATQPALASYKGTPDNTNDRIVPLMSRVNDLNANGSGFLYSSRIVLTSGHTAFAFSNGKRVEFQPTLAVGKPNTNIKSIGQGVKVIKRISAPGYLPNNSPELHDFSILILEKDLVRAEPAQLLTPEIELELLESRAQVKLHGYGNTVDLCAAGEALPCRTNRFKVSDVPRSIVATVHPAEDFPELVGYEVSPNLTDQLLFFSPGKSSMCGGDSGGSLTTIYNDKLLYLANIGTADRIYACGQSPSFDGRGGINYSQPIYQYLDLIKEAEAFVAKQIANEKSAASSNKGIKCVKGATTKTIKGADAKCPAGYTKR